MIAMDNGFIFITVFFVASLVQVNALQCWTCSSETESHAEFCGKHFLKNKIPETLEKNGKVFTNCTVQLNDNKKLYSTEEAANLIPVCRKKTIKVNDEIIYQRHCDTIDKRAAKSIACKDEKKENNKVEVIECEDCQYDYCNESFITLPQLLHFITPILLAKILLY